MKHKLLWTTPLVSVLTIAPAALIASCAQTSDSANDQASLQTLQAHVKQINETINWKADYINEGVAYIPEGTWDEIIKGNHDLLIDLLNITKSPDYTYRVSSLQPEAHPDQPTNVDAGLVKFQIEITNQNQQKATTNLLSLKFIKSFKSEALKAQKTALISAMQTPGAIKPSNQWPAQYDPSVVQYLKATALEPRVKFDAWIKAMFSKFVTTEQGISGKIDNLYVKKEPKSQNDPTEIYKMFIDISYHDEQTNEKWVSPSIKFSIENLYHEAVNLISNKNIIENLVQHEVISLKPTSDPLTADNLLAYTNFDEVKDNWMVNTDITYQVIDFKQTDQTIKFKIKLSHNSNNQTTAELTLVNRQSI